MRLLNVHPDGNQLWFVNEENRQYQIDLNRKLEICTERVFNYGANSHRISPDGSRTSPASRTIGNQTIQASMVLLNGEQKNQIELDSILIWKDGELSLLDTKDLQQKWQGVKMPTEPSGAHYVTLDGKCALKMPNSSEPESSNLLRIDLKTGIEMASFPTFDRIDHAQASDDGNVVAFQTKKGLSLLRSEKPHSETGLVGQFLLSRGGNWLATIDETNRDSQRMELRDINDILGEPRKLIEAVANTNEQLSFWPIVDSEKLIAVSSYSHVSSVVSIQFWDTHTRQKRIEIPLASPIRRGALSRDETIFAYCGLDGIVRVHSIADGSLAVEPFQLSGLCSAMQFSQDGQTLMCRTERGITQVLERIDVGTAVRMRSINYIPNDQPRGLDYALLSSDEQRLILADSDRLICFDVGYPSVPSTPLFLQAYLEVLSHLEVDSEGSTKPLSFAAEQQRYEMLASDTKFWKNVRETQMQSLISYHLAGISNGLADSDSRAAEFHLQFMKQRIAWLNDNQRIAMEQSIARVQQLKDRLSKSETLLTDAKQALRAGRFSLSASLFRDWRESIDDTHNIVAIQSVHEWITSLIGTNTRESLAEALELLFSPDCIRPTGESFAEFGEGYTDIATHWILCFSLWSTRADSDSHDLARERILAIQKELKNQNDQESSDWWKISLDWLDALEGKSVDDLTSLTQSVNSDNCDSQDLMFLAIAMDRAGQRESAQMQLTRAYQILDEESRELEGNEAMETMRISQKMLRDQLDSLRNAWK
jgi:hypothetical protein